jgi:hypothetical protein
MPLQFRLVLCNVLNITTKCAHEHENMKVSWKDFPNVVKISHIVVKVFTQNLITIDIKVSFG